MTLRNCLKMVLAVVLMCPLAGSVVMAQPINGDFSNPLGPDADGLEWEYDPSTVSSSGGVAVLGEDMYSTAYLEQAFTIPDLAVSLSFEYKPRFQDFDPSDPFGVGYGDNNEESFSAFLLDPITGLPLVPTDADTTLPGPEAYYFMHDWDFYMGVDEVVTDPAYVTVTDLGTGWFDVTLDLTTLGGTATGAQIAFDLVSGFYDYGLNSQVEIDNVSVAIVPAFSSVTLGLLGFGAIGALRRRRRERDQ